MFQNAEVWLRNSLAEVQENRDLQSFVENMAHEIISNFSARTGMADVFPEHSENELRRHCGKRGRHMASPPKAIAISQRC